MKNIHVTVHCLTCCTYLVQQFCFLKTLRNGYAYKRTQPLSEQVTEYSVQHHSNKTYFSFLSS